MDDLPPQPLGTEVCEQDQSRLKSPAEDSDRGAGEKGADHFVGYAQEQHPVLRSYNSSKCKSTGGELNETRAKSVALKIDVVRHAGDLG